MPEKLLDVYCDDAIVAESQYDTAQDLERARVTLVVAAAEEAEATYGEPKPIPALPPEPV